MATENVTTVRHYGHYTVTGPVALPLGLPDGRIVEFQQEGFKFPGGRYSALFQGDIHGAGNLLLRITSNCQWAFYFDSKLCDCKWLKRP